MPVRKSKSNNSRKRQPRRITHPPRLEELLEAERQLLRARFGAARAALSSHSGELGASLEYEALSFLRTFLPREYGLGRGFIVWREKCRAEDATWEFDEEPYRVAVSPQLDIIIYDAVRGGSVADLGSSQVFPIEHVFGYVEVKAVFQDELAHTLEVSRLLREPNVGFYSARPEAFRPLMTQSYWAVVDADLRHGPHRANTIVTAPIDRPRIGCWFIGFEYERTPPKRGRRMAEIRKSFESSWKRVSFPAHLHGVLIADVQTEAGMSEAVFLKSLPDHAGVRPFTSDVNSEGAIGRFKRDMLTDLVVFQRVPADIAVNYEGYWAK
ncbi:MAG: hypothetical protein RLO52_42780 [Sandaracinaceae bacterium]